MGGKYADVTTDDVSYVRFVGSNHSIFPREIDKAPHRVRRQQHHSDLIPNGESTPSAHHSPFDAPSPTVLIHVAFCVVPVTLARKVSPMRS